MMKLLSLLLLLPCLVQAEVFLWIDGEGNKHYSDQWHQNARQLKIHKGYSYYQVKKIYDGDTLLLANGKKVRFLGINAPEVEGRNKLAQAGGERAKRWLKKQLLNTKVRLETDTEKKDKYNRLLAHVFTQQKVHLNLELVRNGLAAVNIYPPNLKYTKQLLSAQQHAEKREKGVWKSGQYKPMQAKQIKSGRYKGWQRVVGIVHTVHHSRKYSYLNFTDHFSVKIARNALSLFPKLEDYLGEKVEVRGWIKKQNKRYSLFVRHSSAIIPIE